ncbi:MAG: efflux RND transporter permease subunit [Hyphomicrobiaceae bacterium]|nr:efflux RND transporter permease subunit [Hyphomicrobiaceae bacterium]
MLVRLAEFSVRFRVLVLAAAAALVFFGSARLRQMPVDILPEFSPPMVEIQTEALGLSAAEVETMVSLGLEELMAALPWLKRMQSDSVAGLSSVRLEFEPGTSLMRARQLVQERLTTAFLLPNVAKAPIMQQPTSSTNRVMMVALSSKALDPIALTVLTQWTIKPKLLGIPGVAKVAVWGERKRQLQVQVDPEALRQNNLTLRQIIASTGDSLWVSNLSFLKASAASTGGFLDTPNQRMEIRHILPVSSPADLAKIAIEGTKLKLGDVASVVEGHPPLIGDAIVEEGQGLLLVIEKFPGVSTLEVTRGVEQALDDLRPGLGGVKIDAHAFRPASFVEWSLVNLGRVGLCAGALAVAAMAALLLNWRALAIGLVSIPVALVASAVVLDAFGVTANALLLAGLGAAFATVVDDLVLASAALGRRHGSGGGATTGGLGIGATVRNAAVEGRGSIVFATLVSLLAASPVFFMAGDTGTFLRPLALAYVTALIVSWAVTVTIVPALAAVLTGPRAGQAPGATAAVGNARAPVDRLAAAVVANPFWAIIALVQLVVIAVAIAPVLHGARGPVVALLPRFDERDMVIHWEAQPGISRDEMFNVTSKVSRELRAVSGIRSVNAHLGRAISGDQPVGIGSSRIWVRVDPEADYHRVLAAVQAVLSAYPGMEHRIHSYLNDRLGNTLAGGDGEFTVRVYGQRRAELAEIARTVRDAIARVDGLWNVRVRGVPSEPHVQVEVDLAKAAQHGIKPGDVRRAASTLFAGLEVGQIFESQKVFEIVVWSKPEARRDLDSIRNALIELPGGGHVRLGEVATVEVLETPSMIRREQISQFVDIVGSARGRDVGAIAADVDDRLRNIEFKLGYHPKVLSVASAGSRLDGRVLAALATAVLGILLLLHAAFGSWRLAGAVLLALPLAIWGGVTAALVVDQTVSLGTLLGLFAVLSITVRQAIGLIGRALELATASRIAPGQTEVGQALAERAPSILVAAVAIALAMVPALYFAGGPGLEIVTPMAVAVLGGLATSTLFVLLVVPGMVMLLGGEREPDLAPELAQ